MGSCLKWLPNPEVAFRLFGYNMSGSCSKGAPELFKTNSHMSRNKEEETVYRGGHQLPPWRRARNDWTWHLVLWSGWGGGKYKLGGLFHPQWFLDFFKSTVLKDVTKRCVFSLIKSSADPCDYMMNSAVILWPCHKNGKSVGSVWTQSFPEKQPVNICRGSSILGKQWFTQVLFSFLAILSTTRS